MRDNVFGSIEEDALRRDFTVNALYFNIEDNTVVDFVGGMEDLRLGVFRLLGDPVQRCEEDPVRALRAARLSAKLDFSIDEQTLDAMYETAPMLESMPPARLFEETLKMFQGGYAVKSFEKLLELELFEFLFPATAERLEDHATVSVDESLADDTERQLIVAALKNTDARVQQGLPITPAYLLAFMQWGGIYRRARKYLLDGNSPSDALWRAGEDLLSVQQHVTAIPRRLSGPMREIWGMQPALEQYSGPRALGLMESRRFRAAYDFLCLRASFDDGLSACASWWTDVQEMNDEEKQEFLTDKPVVTHHWGEIAKRRRRSRKPRRNSRSKSKHKSTD